MMQDTNGEQNNGLGDLSFPQAKSFYNSAALENGLIFITLTIAIIAALYILHEQLQIIF